MKKYLMTWYGITDLRASLGFEKTSGPVLAALLAEDYTDVIILGFSHPDKAQIKADVFQHRTASNENTVPEAASEIVEQFSNSAGAHKHFSQWLEKRLRDAAKNVTVRMQPVVLRHLNDTERIYEVATKCLKAVASLKGEKLVTLYLSPGTPVMAFVWAFAALGQPNLKKRLIASSQPGRPPEEIVLPNEWLEWHGRQVRTSDDNSDQYDVIFHLFGEQRIPGLLGVIQFSSRKHIFVSSAQFTAAVMKQFIGDAEYGEISVNPYDPESVRSAILVLIEKMPANLKIGFNLTGGTKLMYAGALAACRKVNATPFYFDGGSCQLVYLNDFKRLETKRITSVETFIKLNGNSLTISKPGNWSDIPGIDDPKRLGLTKKLWTQRSELKALYPRIAPYNDRPGNDFEFSHKNISVSLEAGHRAEVIIRNRAGKLNAYRFKNWRDFARYLSGGWFEEYTYMKLQPLVKKGLIQDLRIGLEVSLRENPIDRSSSFFRDKEGNRDTYQEIDVAFTDGRRLYVVECKAGSVRGEYVRKLESITRYFGGIGARGLLTCCLPPRSAIVRQKAKESNNVELLAGGELFDELEALIYQSGGGA